MLINPTFTIYTGPMFSSKTTRLLMELERYRHQRKSTIAFKPDIDDRYSENISTHGGWSWTAVRVTEGADILKCLADCDDEVHVIAVDEAFMIPGIAEVLIFLYRNGFNIIVSSLDFAANGKPFPEMAQMLPWATRIEKCTAVCTVCGRDALYTYKKQTGGDEFVVEVGGAELYEPRCFEHHLAINNCPKK